MPRYLKLVALVLFGGVVAWLSFAQAITGAGKKNPALVLRVSPADPAALALMAEVELAKSKKPERLGSAESLARKSLEAQVLNPRALRQLGMIQDLKTNKPSAERWMVLSEKLSRREFGAQFWLALRAAEKDNLSASVRHIDIGLKTNPRAYDALLPLLTKAISNVEVQQEVARTLKGNPSWLGSFLEYAISQSQDLGSVANVMKTLPAQMPGLDGHRYDTALLQQLVAKKEYRIARDYYLAKPTSGKAVLSSLALSEQNVSPATEPFGWQPLENVAGTADFVSEKNGADLYIGVDYARSGDLAGKVLYLEPGSYRFTVNYGDVSGNSPPALHYKMMCLSPEQPTAFTTVAHSGIRANGVFAFPVTVPGNCLAQKFIVATDFRDAVKDSEIAILNFAIGQGKANP